MRWHNLRWTRVPGASVARRMRGKHYFASDVLYLAGLLKESFNALLDHQKPQCPPRGLPKIVDPPTSDEFQKTFSFGSGLPRSTQPLCGPRTRLLGSWRDSDDRGPPSSALAGPDGLARRPAKSRMFLISSGAKGVFRKGGVIGHGTEAVPLISLATSAGRHTGRGPRSHPSRTLSESASERSAHAG